LQKNQITAFATLCAAAALPFLTLADFNKTSNVDYGLLLFYGLGLIVVAFAAIFLIKLAAPRLPLERLCYAAAVFLVLLFSYDLFATTIKSLKSSPRLSLVVGIWAVVTAAAVAASYIWSKRREGTLIIFTVIAVMTALPAAKLIVFHAPHLLARDRSDGGQRAASDLKSRPNIYYFILDGYGRADKIKELLNFDNSKFIDGLRERGFFVADKGTANYPSTWLSIASTMSERYVQTPDMPPYRSILAFHKTMKGKNAAVETLQRNGYKYVYVANGHFYYQCPGFEDHCIEGRNSRPFFQPTEINLLKSTPAYDIILKYYPDLIIQPFLKSLAQVADVADAIVNVPLQKPYYVYAHLLVPHPPFVLDAECQRTGNTNINLRGWFELPIKGYTDYLQCVNKQMTELLDRILSKDPDALIVIQGDHGTSFFLDWRKPLKDWSKRGVSERLAPLNAMRLPAQCRDTLYPTMSLINTFPAIFACLEHKKPSYLPDISYISPDTNNPEFGHVLRVDPYAGN